MEKSIQKGDKKLVQDKDYTVSYENNVSVGTAKIVIRGTGLYHNKYSKRFRIVPSGTTISRLSAGKKSLTVKWKKQTNQTSGYQIQCSTSKSFKNNTKTITVKSRNKASRTIMGLKAKTGYYVRIRTYKVVDGKQYNSSWSYAKIKKTK